MSKVTKLLALAKKIKGLTDAIKDGPKGKSTTAMRAEVKALKAKLSEMVTGPKTDASIKLAGEELLSKLTSRKSPGSKQSGKERGAAATGSASATTTQAGDKSLSISSYRSMTDKARATAKANAKADFAADKITKTQMNTIVKRIDAANASEVDTATRKMQQGSRDKKAPPVSLKAPMNFNMGGMSKAKPRTGNMDYRMGGMFMKNGKK